MAEAIGLVASVLQLAGTGLKLSQALYQYADSVATADRRIKDVAKEIKLTSFVIEELGGIFKQDDTLSLISKSAIATANETLDECSTMFGEIEVTLNKSKKGKMGRLLLPFREPKIELLRSHIDKLKSTLQLLMQVLMHAFQVASKKLDREAEAKQRDEIRQLLENKKNTTKRYEESLQRFKTSDSNTEFEDDEVFFDDNGSVSTLVAKSIGSTMTPDSLAECAQHVRTLLESIERLQQALASTSEGDDQSDDHQMVIGSYFAARSHLDSVLLGSSNTGNKNVMLKTEQLLNVEAVYRTSKPKISVLETEKKEPTAVIAIGAGEVVVERAKTPVRLQGTKKPEEDITYVQRPKSQGHVFEKISISDRAKTNLGQRYDEHSYAVSGEAIQYSCRPSYGRQSQAFGFGGSSGYSYNYATIQGTPEQVEICVPVSRSSVYAPALSLPAQAPGRPPLPFALASAPLPEPAPTPVFDFEPRDHELDIRMEDMGHMDAEIASSLSGTTSRGNDEVDDLLKEWTTCF
ncbi:hypothetical protein COCVIDRAFT_24940 [Bipolaris victoriae FI3]|uniref:Fungal N-terminal domain-containing protein n=1 Tax=Bipolaris victoriae (strain FI3) TaxID=930091 RepID=W7EQ51_BIPV3|nr:hypothetical protein COCVIDRAFT_24940 [Bipolaris victoriae FI3]